MQKPQNTIIFAITILNFQLQNFITQNYIITWKKKLFVENYNNCINLRFIFLSFEGLIFLSLKTFNFQLLLFKGQVKLNFYRSNFKCVIVNTTYFTRLQHISLSFSQFALYIKYINIYTHTPWYFLQFFEYIKCVWGLKCWCEHKY